METYRSLDMHERRVTWHACHAATITKIWFAKNIAGRAIGGGMGVLVTKQSFHALITVYRTPNAINPADLMLGLSDLDGTL